MNGAALSAFVAMLSFRNTEREIQKMCFSISAVDDLLKHLWSGKSGLVPERLMSNHGISADVSLRSVEEWKPIETAPKDGSYIWLGSQSSIRVGFWRDGAEYENHGSVGGGWRDMCMSEQLGMCDLHFAPTHWMPTPRPPE